MVQSKQKVGAGEYAEQLSTLSEGSVTRRFDPYLDIDWDSPEFAIDPADPRWKLSETSDPLGAHPWYQSQPLEKQLEIGMWRQANVCKVGLAFESILIRGMMHVAMTMPNGSKEFRYCLHEMAEECNHIQMFQELVNRIGVDAPGMRFSLRLVAPWLGVLGGLVPTVLFIGILAGEEPIDHTQKSLIREGANIPTAVLRTMQIHIAEEARHISFAHMYLQKRISRQGPIARGATSIVFPIVMRWLADEIMTPPRRLAKETGIPRKVMREAFWKNPRSKQIRRGFFGDVRMLAEELDLMNPVAKAVWRAFGIDGEASRYRGEPDRRVHAAA
ncbi:AurF N-oxygenase family protein [Actinomadura macrotermitis]|uniref:Diiron oxygenase n=1 Tax=Actinomadura macrotermitis TaxID=2585200 RepID=A0A7K0BR29_9ACTN|nr:diiron oxygenase [Actinomadura macrotermitis]MQY03643.1 hypothetical protein [Actinomadura macrotermitis]